MKLLRIFDLDKYADVPAGSLPYGQQRKLEIARAWLLIQKFYF